jgi:Tfp pilus assembly protein PilF
MVKHSKKKTRQSSLLPFVSGPETVHQESVTRTPLSGMWVPLLLAIIAFLVYLPSLRSGFVYDARIEIEEGFLTSISNLPAVLSFKVLGMNLMLADRPGLLLFMMLIAAVCGKHPFGYHLCSNLLHAANVALLFILLRRLIAQETTGMAKRAVLKAQLAAIAATLIFAVHPIVVEPVAGTSYASDLLVAFFLLVALLAATAFRPETFRVALITGFIGTLCCFAAATCKESGIAVPLLLIVYWFLFRRRERNTRWLLFLGAAITASISFFVVLFHSALPSTNPLPYLGGSFSQVFLIQPRLWVFMMGKLLWPTHLSADYTPQNFSGLSVAASLVILAVVISLQVWLIRKSRAGALGAAIYWLGLATVSNFVPLHRILADRFYYVPLAGVAMQMLAVLLMASRTLWGFRAAMVCLVGALLPLTFLTMTREPVFASDSSLWSDTLQVSPFSSTALINIGREDVERGQIESGIAEFKKALEISPGFADAHANLGAGFFKIGHVDEAIIEYHKALEISPSVIDAHANLGVALLQIGHIDEGIAEFKKALEINPYSVTAHSNLGFALFQTGHVDEAITEYRKALEISPSFVDAHANLGVALMRKGHIDEGIAEFKKALEIDPYSVTAHSNLGFALFQTGHVDRAIPEYQKALEISPSFINAHANLASALMQMGQLDEAMAEFRKILEIRPDNSDAYANLGNALLQKGRVEEAFVHYQKALQINPNNADAHNDLGAAFLKKGQLDEAVEQFQEALRLKPDSPDTRNNLAYVEAMARQRTRQK